MKQLLYYISDKMNPWYNLAVEEAILKQVPEDTVILYLWQNQRTVVIGKNQNCWAECNIAKLEEDGGYLARRLSGGGCVYHDDKNLNFTFLANEKDYDVDLQTEVILSAVKSFGLEAKKNGRNDITIDGRKFSGNAFYKKDGKCYHHGTILIDTDSESMNRYLNVSAEKLKSKGVASVKSRVINLKELSPDISVAAMKKALLTAASEVYGITPVPTDDNIYDKELATELEEKNASWEWRFGRKIPFSWEKKRRFEWGEVHIQLDVNEGIIQNAAIYSDAMDGEFIEELAENMVGQRYGSQKLSVGNEMICQEVYQQMLTDINSLMMEEKYDTI